MQRYEAQEMADEIAARFDERLDDMVRCWYCGAQYLYLPFDEDQDICPECGVKAGDEEA